MKIRQIDASTDLQAFKAIRVESPRDTPASFRATEEEMRSTPIEMFEQQLADNMCKFIGAFLEGDLIGVAALFYEESQKLSHKDTVGAVFVKPEHRNKGVGQSLIKELLGIAGRDTKLRQLNLAVNTTNITPVRLYENLGFSIFGTEKNAACVDGTFHDEHHMQHVLQPTRS